MSGVAALMLTLVSSWVVLPIHSANPPPQDPTLLRLSKKVAESIHDAVDAKVRVASREERDERCPAEDGHCPEELAALLDAERAVVLVLDAKFANLLVRVYRGKIGVEREGSIPCRWYDGSVECELDKLAKIFAEGSGPDALKEGEVEKAFAAMKSRIEKCGASKPPEAWINFKVRPDGRVYDVRIDPKELGEEKGFACIATTVESLKMRKFSGAPQSFRFSLLPPADEPKKKKARKK